MMRTQRRSRREGVLLPLAALLLVVILGMAAFSIDIGYMIYVESELQNAADASALAGAAATWDGRVMFSLAKALAAALSGIPISWSRVSTSDRFTALIEAFARREGSKRVKGSPTNRAITADASATIPTLFTRRLGAAFVD